MSLLKHPLTAPVALLLGLPFYTSLPFWIGNLPLPFGAGLADFLWIAYTIGAGILFVTAVICIVKWAIRWAKQASSTALKQNLLHILLILGLLAALYFFFITLSFLYFLVYITT